MNALWIDRMARYKYGSNALPSAHAIIRHKVERERALLRHFGLEVPDDGQKEIFHTVEELLLYEARSAHIFWRKFGNLLPAHVTFPVRAPGAGDTVNKFLDIGFHHLTGIVATLLEKHAVPSALALLHTARSSGSKPLAYDLVEIFRADIVDAELLRFLRLKKKPVEHPEHETAHFIHEINERLTRTHYVHSFSQCLDYRYYMELQILHFISAVNHNEVFEPLRLPDRHDSRCLTHRNGVVE